MTRLRFLRKAADEAEAEAAWCEKERPGLGAKFFEAIEGDLDVIEDVFLPLSPVHEISGNQRAKLFILRRFLYDIVVVERGD